MQLFSFLEEVRPCLTKYIGQNIDDNPSCIIGLTLLVREASSTRFLLFLLLLLPWGVYFEIKLSQGRYASIAFILHQGYEMLSKFNVSLVSKRQRLL